MTARCRYGDCDTSAGYLDGMCLAHWEQAQVAVPALLAEAIESMTTWQTWRALPPPALDTAASRDGNYVFKVYLPAKPPEYIPDMDYRPVRTPRLALPAPRRVRQRSLLNRLLARLRATVDYHRRIADVTAARWYPWTAERPPAWRAPWWAWTTVAGGLVLAGVEAGVRLPL